ncbi:MAG: aminomethyl-transferring glycine dehydrogenase subunit GcvPA [Treponema sp.]|nr:aminomethyl-transferring glycine dehydrogenase subunit GcvPA [Treponema sp.]
MAYLPNTKNQEKEMLDFLGLGSPADLYRDIPQKLRAQQLDIPKGQSELEVLRNFTRLAGKNTVFSSVFRGAGAYRHFIPSIVGETVSKKRFKTAYTPYQPEVSQGVLQGLFEFQTIVCRLTGFEVTNASAYDGASAAGEAAAMCRDRKRKRTLVSAAVNPSITEVVKTYSWASNNTVDIVPAANGLTDMSSLATMLTDDVASVMIQQPNYYGLIEDASGIVKLAHEKGVKVIMSVNPMAMAIVQTPAECGADIAVGEGQPLGIPLSFGGPYVGFMAATKEFLRKIPGRIVGETTDSQGRRAFVLTLQAREQHIRRETASSNMCTSQVLCALATSVYVSAMGPSGLQEAARQSMSKAHYLAGELARLAYSTNTPLRSSTSLLPIARLSLKS